MRKLTSVLAAVAVAVSLAIPMAASAKLNHKHPKRGCGEGLSHRDGPGCGKGRHDGNLSHRFQDGPFG
jgi:hypothetical protein